MRSSPSRSRDVSARKESLLFTTNITTKRFFHHPQLSLLLPWEVKPNVIDCVIPGDRLGDGESETEKEGPRVKGSRCSSATTMGHRDTPPKAFSAGGAAENTSKMSVSGEWFPSPYGQGLPMRCLLSHSCVSRRDSTGSLGHSVPWCLRNPRTERRNGWAVSLGCCLIASVGSWQGSHVEQGARNAQNSLLV